MENFRRIIEHNREWAAAMKAADPARAFGAVIGKALRPMREGCGLIPILVSLQ